MAVFHGGTPAGFRVKLYSDSDSVTTATSEFVPRPGLCMVTVWAGPARTQHAGAQTSRLASAGLRGT